MANSFVAPEQSPINTLDPSADIFFFKFIFGQILVPRGTIYEQGRGSGGIEPDPDSNLVKKKRIRPTKKPTEIWPHT